MTLILTKRFLCKRLSCFLVVFFSVANAYGHTSAGTCSSAKTPIPGCVVATPATVGNTGLEVDFYAGASRNTTSNTSGVVLSPIETDTLTQANKNSSSFVPGVGIAYNYAFPQRDYFYIHQVSIGLNYYHTGASRDGQVYQYGLSQFNNYTYKMNISSNRLMLDGEVDLHPLWHGLTVFGEAGAGGALNNMSYSEEPLLGTTGGSLNMGGNTHLAFASEFGGGLKMPVTKKSEISVRYLYANLGKAESSAHSNNGVELEEPISTDLTSQSVLLGYAYHME